MSKQDDLSADHISWLVKSRSANQEVTLKLFLIIKDNEETLKKNWDLANFAQAMAAVCFSLWRAVFLSDVSPDEYSLDETVAAAKDFLGNLILHNTVAYTHDRNTRDWSFIYYVNNARSRLKLLSEELPDLLPQSFVGPADAIAEAKDYWTYHHNASEVAVRNLEGALRKISN